MKKCQYFMVPSKTVAGGVCRVRDWRDCCSRFESGRGRAERFAGRAVIRLGGCVCHFLLADLDGKRTGARWRAVVRPEDRARVFGCPHGAEGVEAARGAPWGYRSVVAVGAKHP